MFENLKNSIDAQLEKGKMVLICQIVPKEKFRNDYNVNRSINNITLVHYDRRREKEFEEFLLWKKERERQKIETPSNASNIDSQEEKYGPIGQLLLA